MSPFLDFVLDFGFDFDFGVVGQPRSGALRSV
jgi:hypothetical protein